MLPSVGCLLFSINRQISVEFQPWAQPMTGQREEATGCVTSLATIFASQVHHFYCPQSQEDKSWEMDEWWFIKGDSTTRLAKGQCNFV